MNQSVENRHFLHPAAAPASARQELMVTREILDSWHALMKAMEGISGMAMELSCHEYMGGGKDLLRGREVESPVHDSSKIEHGGECGDRGSLMGFPVMWPQGTVLGILKVCFPGPCADMMERKQVKAMAHALKKTMEADLELLYGNSVLRNANDNLRASILGRQNLNIPPVICSYCKKIKDKEESWKVIEHFFHSHYRIKFSHGICPDCSDELIKKI